MKSEMTDREFISLIRIKSDEEIGTFIDSLTADEKNPSVDDLLKQLEKLLDHSTSEYFNHYREAQPGPDESYAAYAMRLRALYQKASGSNTLTIGETKLLVEKFISSLPTPESTILRMAATAEELEDIDLLSKRASNLRTARRQSLERSHVANEHQEDYFEDE